MMLNMAFYIHWMCVRQNALVNRFECTVRTMFGVIKNHPTKLWGWFFFGWWNWIPKLNCTNGLTERERDSKMRENVSFYFIALAYLSMFSLFLMLCFALLIKNKGVKKTQILHTEKNHEWWPKWSSVMMSNNGGIRESSSWRSLEKGFKFIHLSYF